MTSSALFGPVFDVFQQNLNALQNILRNTYEKDIAVQRYT